MPSGRVGEITVGFRCTDAAGINLFMSLDIDQCDATKTVVELSGAGEQIIGISRDVTPGTNQNMPVDIFGIGPLIVDGNAGTIAPRDRLKANASGQGVKTTTDTEEYGAIALEDSTTAGETIQVLIRTGMIAG